jgi:hypothetical protein
MAQYRVWAAAAQGTPLGGCADLDPGRRTPYMIINPADLTISHHMRVQFRRRVDNRICTVLLMSRQLMTSGTPQPCGKLDYADMR